jgi:hypothetical protein
MNEKQKHSCRESFCGSGPFTRENYYFGKLLTAQALQGEQHYLNEKRRLINRYGIGWGVLCGLKVIPDCNNPCGGVIVQPGLALDQNGNEIIVCEPRFINLNSACKTKEKNNAEDPSEPQAQKLYILLCYKECPSNPSPIPVDNCGTSEDKCEYNRTKETFEIKIVCEKPDESADELPCELRCTDNPFPFVIEECPPRHQGCVITLACICYIENTPIQVHQIDNVTYRKLAFSNDILYAMIRCLGEEAHQAKGDHHDRRQHIPLLANTIKGLTYVDGRIAKIEAGKHPFRITSDGDFIWITDLESPELIRIDRKSNKPIKDKPLDLSRCDKLKPPIEFSWGVAFDGTYLWVTHNNTDAGKLTRVNACNPEDRWTFNALPSCNKFKDCESYCIEHSGKDLKELTAYPQEVVYHQNRLYVSHGWAPEQSTEIVISIIDTERCCLVETVTITEADCDSIYSPVSSMVSDGEALWVAYTAKKDNAAGDLQPVVQKIEYDPLATGTKFKKGKVYKLENGQSSGKLAFDGTHLWLTHEDGASKIKLSTGKVVSNIDTQQTQFAIAYGGGDNIWTAEHNNTGRKAEARLLRSDIYSVDQHGEIEFDSDIPADYVITDAQFDGVFIYVSAYSGSSKQGFIHRILP